MPLPGIAVYIIVLLLLAGALYLGYTGYARIRQRRAARPFFEDDNDDETFTDVPLVMRPRNASTIVSPVPLTPPPGVAPSRPAAVFNAPEPPGETDAPMQLLPGRLEPLNSEVQQEIRFIKRAGIDRFTLGRSSGPAYTHVQLSSPTASRMHAYMRIESGRWYIGNLSETNPVIVNGSALDPDAERPLENRDLIELGETIFVFRDR